MVCQVIGVCLFLSFIVQCSGQTDLVGRCETCREVVRNFQKVNGATDSSVVSNDDTVCNLFVCYVYETLSVSVPNHYFDNLYEQ